MFYLLLLVKTQYKEEFFCMTSTFSRGSRIGTLLVSLSCTLNCKQSNTLACNLCKVNAPKPGLYIRLTPLKVRKAVLEKDPYQDTKDGKV